MYLFLPSLSLYSSILSSPVREIKLPFFNLFIQISTASFHASIFIKSVFRYLLSFYIFLSTASIKLATGIPFSPIYFISGSLVNLPTKIILFNTFPPLYYINLIIDSH